MRLILRICSPRPDDVEATHIFSQEGGTVGRSPSNAWVLHNKKVSGCHAVVSFRSGVFYIQDISRNGVSINHPSNRLVHERPYALKSGDVIFIEPYEIRVLVATTDAEDDLPDSDDPFGPVRTPHVDPQPPVPPPEADGEIDPLKLLEPGAPPLARPPKPPGRKDEVIGEPDGSPPSAPVKPGATIPRDCTPRSPDDDPFLPAATGTKKITTANTSRFGTRSELPTRPHTAPGTQRAGDTQAAGEAWAEPTQMAAPSAPTPGVLSRMAGTITRIGRWFGSARGVKNETGARSSPPTPADVVKCSVFAPSIAKAGDAVLIQVFAHLPSDDARVKAVAQTFDIRASGRAATLLNQEVERGTCLTFSLTIPGIRAQEPTRALVWRGEPDCVQFAVNIPFDQRDQRLIGTVLVSQNSVPFGHLKFILDVVAKPVAQREPSTSPEQIWKRYEHAFISYASQDRPEVLKRTQMLKLVKIDFFQDLLSLDPGERWERTLYKEIDDSDVFFLFWSTAAKNSEWVMKEIRYAIARHAGDEMAPPEIVPVLIEGPPPVPPPPELNGLHFNDKFLYFIAGSP